MGWMILQTRVYVIALDFQEKNNIVILLGKKQDFYQKIIQFILFLSK